MLFFYFVFNNNNNHQVVNCCIGISLMMQHFWMLEILPPQEAPAPRHLQSPEG